MLIAFLGIVTAVVALIVRLTQNQSKSNVEWEVLKVEAPAASQPLPSLPTQVRQREYDFSDRSSGLPPLRIIYGTQKGTAERFAKLLQDDALRFGWPDVNVSDMEDYDADTLMDESLVVIIVATYIEGS